MTWHIACSAAAAWTALAAFFLAFFHGAKHVNGARMVPSRPHHHPRRRPATRHLKLVG